MTGEVLGQAEYVIFDMDGLLTPNTLLDGTSLTSDSEEIWTDITNSLLRKYGFTKPYGWEYKVQTMGKPPRQSSETLFSFYPGLTEKVTIDEWIAERSKLHKQAFKSTKPLPGALELVREFKERKVPIAIATGSNDANYKWKTVTAPSLGSAEGRITYRSDSVGGRGKPHPDIYLAAARGLGQDVGTADEASGAQLEIRAKGLVFEDAVLGVNAGVSAGMQVIWIPHPEVRKMFPKETFGAVQVLNSLEDFKPERWGL